MAGRLLLVLVSAAVLGGTNAQAQISDSLWHVELTPIVVTATRTPHELEDVPVPTDVVGRAEIEARGTVRLPELLAEQTGLTLQHDHGTGVQIQGLGPEYTPILVDGVRLLGRTAGTFDLNRISLGNVERIEIIRGPSSSLYGSDALAGVINIITARPERSLQGYLSTRYGTHGTSDLSTYAGTSSGPLSASVYLNRFGSSGYDLDPSSLAPTTPSFADYTAQSNVRLRASNSTTLSLMGRANAQRQESPVEVQVDGVSRRVDDRAHQLDWNLSPTLVQRVGQDYLFTTRLYASRFSSSRLTTFHDDGATYDEEDYAQLYGDAEMIFEGTPFASHYGLLGAGYIYETVEADRVDGVRRTFYAFVQDEWTPIPFLDLVLSTRLDAPSDYDARLSPKIAALIRPADSWRLRVSVGSGYKAPDFRQLYLNFTNPTVGYSVLGSTEIAAGLERMQRDGQIAKVFDTAAQGERLSPESSVAYNLEVSYGPAPGTRYRLGVFRNDVRNLIDTLPIAIRTNGQQVFSYFNLHRVFTQGVEAEAFVQLIDPLSLRIGYQLLDARDRDVLQRIDAGEIFTRQNGRDRVMTREDYGGLMQRSRHQAAIQLMFRSESLGATAMVSSTYRSRYGYADVNGNGVLDVDAEYVDGYALFNLAVSKDIDRFTVRMGLDNVTGLTRPSHVPSLSGREWSGALQYRF